MLVGLRDRCALLSVLGEGEIFRGQIIKEKA